MRFSLALLSIALLLAAAQAAAMKSKKSMEPMKPMKPMKSRKSMKPMKSMRRTLPFRNCRGKAMYKLTFTNFLTRRRFGNLIPKAGLVYSPPIAISHSNRISVLTVRGQASKQVEEIAETGNNMPLAKLARSLKPKGAVLTVATAGGPTMPGKSTTLRVTVDCRRPFVTMLGMIAPSPDWIVQVSNRNLFSERYGKFVHGSAGFLIAYDAGTDSGREFTDPANAALDEPTVPPQNIAPLREDETDRFNGKVVGHYRFKRVY